MSLFFWRDTWHPFINHFTTAKWTSWWDFPMLEWPGDGTCAGQCPARAQHQVGAAASPSARAWCPSGREAGGHRRFVFQPGFCLQAGGTVWSHGDGKSCCVQTRLEKSACFGGGPDKARGGFEGERERPRGPPGVWRRGHPSADDSLVAELVTRSPQVI